MFSENSSHKENVLRPNIMQSNYANCHYRRTFQTQPKRGWFRKDHNVKQDKLKDTKVVIRSHTSKKDRQ